MKKTLIMLLYTLLCSSTVSFTQIFSPSQNIIEVRGYAELSTTPHHYIAKIFIQEEEQKVGYTTVGKLPLDSVKASLFVNLKKLGVDTKELKVLVKSSKDIGQFPNFLLNTLYEVNIPSKEVASKIVSEMRFLGLKGIVIRRFYTKEQKEAISDSLHKEALNDARRSAKEFAKNANRSVGEIKTIDVGINTTQKLGADSEAGFDNFNLYSFSKFEMDYQEKSAQCQVRVIFEMK